MYFALKLIHIAAVVLFLGNIITGLFWHALAARTRDPKVLAFTMDGIIKSDRLFTMPGVMVIIAAGVALAVVGRLPLLGTGWILWSIVLFGVSGALFGLRVAPLQRELRDVAETGERVGEFDFVAYMAVARRWELWGGLALATPLLALVLMVLKPAL
jgi:uncharacterized membrane protein